MASTQAFHFQPASSPPDGALPPLPIGPSQPKKTRTSPPSPDIASSSQSPRLPVLAARASVLRAVSGSHKTSGIPEKTVRRVVSFSAFPNPPQSSTRISSKPPPVSSANQQQQQGVSIRSTAASTDKRQLSKKSSSLSSAAVSPSQMDRDAGATSNRKAPVRSVPGRSSDAQSTIISPPRSIASSLRASCSTPTTLREHDDATAARSASKRKESKGNVIVSVRVRPDFNDSFPSHAEWVIDGKKALISLRGKDGGGDYFYG